MLTVFLLCYLFQLLPLRLPFEQNRGDFLLLKLNSKQVPLLPFEINNGEHITDQR